jgi:hypothetical protein
MALSVTHAQDLYLLHEANLQRMMDSTGPADFDAALATNQDLHDNLLAAQEVELSALYTDADAGPTASGQPTARTAKGERRAAGKTRAALALQARVAKAVAPQKRAVKVGLMLHPLLPATAACILS